MPRQLAYAAAVLATVVLTIVLLAVLRIPGAWVPLRTWSVILPVALQAASSLGLNERTFAITVMLSASVAVVPPFEPSCLLLYGPGKYRFTDYFKVGGGLALLALIVILTMVPWMWPL